MNPRTAAAELRGRAFSMAQDEATRHPWRPIAGMPDPQHPVMAAVDAFTPFRGYLDSGSHFMRVDVEDIIAVAPESLWSERAREWMGLWKDAP